MINYSICIMGTKPGTKKRTPRALPWADIFLPL